ncbi:MAG TPA: hypothetical protein VHE12_08480 [bacterium]|nr:hypothetical protein [bacterium]
MNPPEKTMNRIFSALAAVMFLAAGCASQKEVQSQAIPSQAPARKAAKPAQSTYSVSKGDCLWAISGKVYEDPFQWPLLFKANRDQIHDPDLIYPQQVFQVEKGLEAEDIQKAKKLAGNTPQYVPHSQPRASLPINYF